MYYSVEESSLSMELFRDEYESNSWEEAIDSMIKDAYPEEDSIAYYSPAIDDDKAARAVTVTWNDKKETIVVYQFKGKWVPSPNPYFKNCYTLPFRAGDSPQEIELRAIVWKEDYVWRAGIQPGGILFPSFIYHWEDVASDDSLADIKAKVENLCMLPSNDRYPEIKYP